MESVEQERTAIELSGKLAEGSVPRSLLRGSQQPYSVFHRTEDLCTPRPASDPCWIKNCELHGNSGRPEARCRKMLFLEASA